MAFLRPEDYPLNPLTNVYITEANVESECAPPRLLFEAPVTLDWILQSTFNGCDRPGGGYGIPNSFQNAVQDPIADQEPPAVASAPDLKSNDPDPDHDSDSGSIRKPGRGQVPREFLAYLDDCKQSHC